MMMVGDVVYLSFRMMWLAGRNTLQYPAWTYPIQWRYIVPAETWVNLNWYDVDRPQVYICKDRKYIYLIQVTTRITYSTTPVIQVIVLKTILLYLALYCKNYSIVFCVRCRGQGKHWRKVRWLLRNRYSMVVTGCFRYASWSRPNFVGRGFREIDRLLVQGGQVGVVATHTVAWRMRMSRRRMRKRISKRRLGKRRLNRT